MSERLKKVLAEHPDFYEKLVKYFGKTMPDLLDVYIDGCLYNNHIGSKEVAKLAEPFITNDKGDNIGFRWNYEDVINVARNFTELQDTEFYPQDLWVWANVKYGDLGHIINDTSTIIKYAISELTDTDYPYEEPSQRAYYWLKKHIENSK